MSGAEPTQPVQTGSNSQTGGLTQQPRKRDALGVALLYAAFSSAWILLSDHALDWLLDDPDALRLAGTVKGWLFVVATSALIYLLLIKAGPSARHGGSHGVSQSQRLHWRALGVLAFVVVSGTALVVQQNLQRAKADIAAQLIAISASKNEQLLAWHEERMGDARWVQSHQGIATHWLAWSRSGAPADLAALDVRVRTVLEGGTFQRAELHHPQRGRVWTSRPDAAAAAPRASSALVLEAALRRALAEGTPQRAGPWREPGGAMRLAYLAPLVPDSDHPVVLVLHVDPPPAVHPALLSWPLPQRSAETVLFTAEDDNVVFLSALRFGIETRTRIAVSHADPLLFTARVLRGEARPGELLEGVDYRGVPSFAVVQRVGDTGWWLMSKQDRSELLAPVHLQTLWVVLSGLLSLLAAAVAVYLFQQRQSLASSARDIAALRNAERALSESEARYRLLAENGSDVVGLLDLSTLRFVYVSPSVQQLRGYAVDEVLQQTLEQVLDAGSYRTVSAGLPARLAAFAAGDESARTRTHELAQTHCNGSLVPTEVVTTLISDKSRASLQMLCVSRDISQRRQAQAQISQLSQATEQSPASVIITGLDARIEYVNAAFERISGYSRDEVLGQNPSLLQSGRTPREVYESMWLALKAGRSWSGEITNRHKSGQDYVQTITVAPVRSADGAVVRYLSVQLDITAQRAAEAQAHRLAWFDPLTGLPNRHRLLQELSATLGADLRQDQHSTLLMINIDRFKTINDALGHAAGDQLLRMLADRLQALSRPGDMLARLGADEFGLLQHGLEHDAAKASARALRLAQAAHAAVTTPFALSGTGELKVSVSLGVCLLSHGGTDSPSDILRRADTALHRAKASGTSQTAFFDATMGDVVSERFAMERDLRRGLRAGELRVYLQPQAEAGEHMVSAEALVRWQHPAQGLLGPGLFIGVAEESDLIAELGDWMLEQVCQLLGRLRREGRRLPISVNVSPRQFHKTDFVEGVLQRLADSGACPEDLTLEVTEGVVVDQVDAVVHKMARLTQAGVLFSIDDFGTGYSSLAYLKRLPIHELKIDKSFIQDAPSDSSDAALVEVILSVARHLSLKVVAEGVETQAQADFLNARGQVVHQGYLFGRPVPAEELLARWSPPSAAGAQGAR